MKIVQNIKNVIKDLEASAKDIRQLSRTQKSEKKDEATFVFGKQKQKVSLKKLRLFLVLINLIILLASGVSFSAWKAAKYDWKGSDVHHHLLLDPLDELPELPNQEQLLIKAVHSYIEHIMYLTALNLFFYWFIYGVIVSCRFGGACEVWTLVMSLPHTIMMIIWEVGVAAAVLRVLVTMSSLPWHQLETAHHHTAMAAGHVHRFYSTWGPWLVASYLAAVPVQVFTILLPFLLTQLPYQRDPEVGSQEKQGSEAKILVKEKEASKLGDDGSDYVREDQIELVTRDRSVSMYKCEMPAEKIAKMKEMKMTPFSRIRKLSLSLRNKSAGRSVIDTMNSVYHVHHSQAPVWTILENEKPHPKLVGGLTLAGGVTVCPQDDYMDMEEPNYDDYMYFNDICYPHQSTGRNVPEVTSHARDSPPPYAEQHQIPNMKLYN